MYKLSANNIELIIDTKGGFIDSLKIGGVERSASLCPLFVIRFRGIDGECFYLDSTKAIKITANDKDILFSGFEYPFDKLLVKVTAWAEDGINWKCHVSCVPKEYALEWIELPKACLPRLKDNDPKGGSLLFPYDEGILLTDETLLPRYEPEFPMSGAYFIFPNKVCSQFMAYLFDDIGFYIGAHDPKRGFKGVDFYQYEKGLALQIRLYSGVGYGQDFKTEYPIVWRTCRGNWKSAAELYRQWFEKNLPPRVKPVRENKSLPRWYEDAPLIVTYPVRGIHDMDKMEPNALFPYTNALPILDKIKKATNSQVMALLMHWEGTAPWAPPYVWPPFGGVELFNEFRDALHKQGDLLGVYCSGFGYTTKSTLIQEYNCENRVGEENVLSGVCHSPQNKPELGITCCPYQRYGYDICPVSRRGQELLEEGFYPVFDSGVDYAQILDQNHGGGQYMCYAKDHGHSPMPGEWMTTSMQNLLSKWNDYVPGMLFGCESAAAEPFIGNLLMSDNRFELNYPFGEAVPAFAYIYHEYVRNFMGNQCGCPFDTKCDTLRYRLGYSFSIGDIMTLVLSPNGDLMTHWSTRDFENPPDMDKALLFIRNLLEFYRGEGKKYLYLGKMTPADDITCASIEIPMLRGRDKITLPRLLCSTWEGENGKTAYIVVNPECEAVSFSIGNDSYTAPPLNATLILK